MTGAHIAMGIPVEAVDHLGHGEQLQAGILSILVEVILLSNSDDAKALVSGDCQSAIAQSIAPLVRRI